MGYYTRVFCRSDKFPAFGEIRRHMTALNPAYRVDGEVDDKESYWTNLELYYKEGNNPIPVELNWCDEEGSIGKEELTEFLEEVGSPGLSFKKRKVIRQLKQTKFIICNQLLSDLDDDGFLANDRLMQFFVDGYRGMVHAENEGFYNTDHTVLLKAD